MILFCFSLHYSNKRNIEIKNKDNLIYERNSFFFSEIQNGFFYSIIFKTIKLQCNTIIRISVHRFLKYYA